MNLYSVLLATIVLAVCASLASCVQPDLRAARVPSARKTSGAIWQRTGSIKTMGKSKAASVGARTIAPPRPYTRKPAGESGI
jgi:hypothetical protein